MEFPQLTAQLASLLAILQVILAGRVIQNRFATKTGIGSDGNEILARKIRVHGNLIENAPIFLLLLGLLESLGMRDSVIIGFGLCFLLARLAHAWALSNTIKAHPLRIVGMSGTLLCILSLAGMLLWQTRAM